MGVLPTNPARKLLHAPGGPERDAAFAELPRLLALAQMTEGREEACGADRVLSAQSTD